MVRDQCGTDEISDLTVAGRAREFGLSTPQRARQLYLSSWAVEDWYVLNSLYTSPAEKTKVMEITF